MKKYMRLKAKDARRKAITLEPTKTLYDARNALLRYDISRIIITKKGKPVGIITEKDIARFLYGTAATRRLDEIRVDEVMSKDLVTVKEQFDLNKSAKLMIDKEISSLVVTDSKNNLNGVFTKSDLMAVYAKYYAGKNLVGDYMTKKVLTVTPDENTHMVLLLMTSNNISRVVVVRGHKPVGIITGRDILPVSSLVGPDTSETIKEVFSSHKEVQMIIPSGISAIFLAKDLMKFDPITINSDSDLAESAQIMTRNRITGLPVVDLKGTLVGIITRTDIIRALTI